MERICVFCGSSSGARPEYLQAASELGGVLAKANITLIYGGAGIGLMGAVANGVLDNGGSVIGVMPKFLFDKEVAHTGITDLRIVGSMHERKHLMHDLASGFVVLPGGFGTFDELFETLTWGQLGLQKKPCGILNVAGYFDALLRLVDRSVEERFVRSEHRDLLLVEKSPEILLARMQDFVPHEDVAKWSDPDNLPENN